MKKILTLIALTVLVISSAYAQRMYDSNGRQIGRVDSERYYDGSGRQIGRVDGSNIYDGSGRQLGRVEGDRVYNSSGTQIGRIEGERLYSGSGSQMGRIDGERIYDGFRTANRSSRWLTADADDRLLLLLYVNPIAFEDKQSMKSMAFKEDNLVVL